MADLVAISKERHLTQTWQRTSHYLFAAADPVVMLVSREIPRAMMHMAIGFIESEGGHLPVAVQGLRPGQNLFVSRDGRWLAEYVPTFYRAYPFRLARNQQGAETLCIDEIAGNVSDDPSGEAFFLPDGQAAPYIADVFKLLMEFEKDRQQTRKICDSLVNHGLLEPWPLKAEENDQIVEARGLLRIAETKLYALGSSELVEIRNNGGLMMAFAQLFSMQQIHMLPKLAHVPTGNTGGKTAPKLSEENGIISFSNL